MLLNPFLAKYFCLFSPGNIRKHPFFDVSWDIEREHCNEIS